MTATNRTRARSTRLIRHLLLGAFFGIVLVKSEVVSWFRIQEMFRFQGVHMFGVIGAAVAVAALAMLIVRRFAPRDEGGAPPTLERKPWQAGRRLRYAIGGVLFGLGWGLSGTCPGPIYALIGSGASGALVVLASALVGARAYAALAPRLPH